MYVTKQVYPSNRAKGGDLAEYIKTEWRNDEGLKQIYSGTQTFLLFVLECMDVELI